MSDNTQPERQLSVSIPAHLLEKIVSPPVEIAVDGLANFRWGKDSLRVKTVDVANAIVVNQEVQASAFEQYDVQPKDDEIIFGTRCQTISNLLNAAQSEELINLDLNKDNRLNIQFSDVEYQLSGVNPNGINEPKVPNLNYNTQAIVHSEALQRAQQVIGMMSDTIRFEISNEQFKLSGQGDRDSAEINVELVPNKETIEDMDRKCAAVIIDISDTAKANYGTEFIRYVNKFTPSECFELKLAEDYPLRINTDRGQGDIPTEIIIAPRMDKQ